MALEHWFRRHQPGVYAFAYFRVGRDPDLAADATQATFALALERLGDFDPGRGEMSMWLRTLARNVIRRLLAQHATTSILADSTTLQEAAPRLLQAVAENLGWDGALLWRVDPRDQLLHCARGDDLVGLALDDDA